MDKNQETNGEECVFFGFKRECLHLFSFSQFYCNKASKMLVPYIGPSGIIRKIELKAFASCEEISDCLYRHGVQSISTELIMQIYDRLLAITTQYQLQRMEYNQIYPKNSVVALPVVSDEIVRKCDSICTDIKHFVSGCKTFHNIGALQAVSKLNFYFELLYKELTRPELNAFYSYIYWYITENSGEERYRECIAIQNGQHMKFCSVHADLLLFNKRIKDKAVDVKYDMSNYGDFSFTLNTIIYGYQLMMDAPTELYKAYEKAMVDENMQHEFKKVVSESSCMADVRSQPE